MAHESGLGSPAMPVLEKLKLETIRRNLTVRDVQSLTQRMLRVTLGGDELAGFRSPSPDDHIILFFPKPEGDVVTREFTPRRFDVEARTLAVDFALHEGGIASAWAEQAKPGDPVKIGGPRGSTVISAPDAWWLLIGDETAVPAIGRRLEEMAGGTRVTALIAVTGPEEEHTFETQAELTARWIHRPLSRASDPTPVMKVVSELKLPAGPGIIWIGAEAETARAVRGYCLDTFGHPAEWVQAKAYWSQKDDTHD